MGLFSSIGKIFKGVTKAVSAIGNLAKMVSGILNSPLGNILKSIFPPLGMMSGILNFAGMMGEVANQVGGGADYMRAPQSNYQAQNHFNMNLGGATPQYF